ncbi:MAG: D-isomer specific 2-hydroxyacid dehydrogenase NAD-binding [Oscillospiraceae bacterium]|nr:D-isomer specific 2-hydroxyacid dehydrogenase NAD-binding [Oscillospiraceae bacterium]
MKIVVLDGFAFAKNIDLSGLKSVGEVTFYERTPPEQVVERIGDAQIIFTNKVVISQAVIDGCPNLKYIGVFATGYNTIDTSYCKQKGIVVTNIPNYSTDAVAQHVFALILHFYSRVAESDTAVKGGAWQNCPDFCYLNTPIAELRDKTLGIIGFGNIGERVSKIALAFNMNVVVYSRTPKPEYENENLSFVSLDELLTASDIVTIHCPLVAETRKLINEQNIDKMKNNAIIINTARGPIVDEQALVQALNEGRIAGAGADVVSKEPILESNPLLSAKNCVITPHVAWAPLQTRQRLMKIAVENLVSFLDGNPINVVSN